MATRLASSTKKARELEVARRLAGIFERMPLGALHSLISNLVDGIHTELPGASGEQARGRRWRVREPAPALHWPSTPFVELEVNPHTPLGDDKARDRFDLVVPIPAVEVQGRLVTSLVFEFKLGRHDIQQLRRYADAAPNSLIVSVASDGDFEAMKQEFDSAGRLLVFQQWNHVYYLLQSMLSGDAQLRVVTIAEPDDLLLKVDHRIAGQDRLAFEIEGFLELLIERGLLSNPDLVLVVPMGQFALQTLQAQPPHYRHPVGWRAGYSYLVAIAGNTVQQSFVVVRSVTTEPVNGSAPERPEGFPEALWQDIAGSSGSRVALLRPAGAGDPPALLDVVGKRYEQRAQKRNATFTMSHRYLEHPDALRDYFNK